MRGTALGLASGVGRVGSIVGPSVTGALVTAGIAYPWGFYFFSGVAVLAVVAMAAVPRRLETEEELRERRLHRETQEVGR